MVGRPNVFPNALLRQSVPLTIPQKPTSTNSTETTAHRAAAAVVTAASTQDQRCVGEPGCVVVAWRHLVVLREIKPVALRFRKWSRQINVEQSSTEMVPGRPWTPMELWVLLAKLQHAFVRGLEKVPESAMPQIHSFFSPKERRGFAERHDLSRKSFTCEIPLYKKLSVGL